MWIAVINFELLKWPKLNIKRVALTHKQGHRNHHTSNLLQ